MKLLIRSIEFDAAKGEVRYRVLSNGTEQEFTATAIDHGGIRSLQASEDFDCLLQSLLSKGPDVIKRLVRKAWAVITGDIHQEALEL